MLFATHSGNLEHKNRDISDRRMEEKQYQGTTPVISGEDNFRAVNVREPEYLWKEPKWERNTHKNFYSIETLVLR